MKSLVIIGVCFLSSFLLNGQVQKLNSIYTNLQAQRNISYLNPLDLGVSFNTKKEKGKLTLGLSGYYPVNYINNTYNPVRGSFGGYSYYGNGNTYHYVNRLASDNDTFRYELQGLSNQGLGISIGLTQDFKLFKILDLKTGLTLSNMINFHSSYYQIERRYTSGSGNGVAWNKEFEVDQRNKKVKYVPVLRIFIGAEFKMGKHIQLVPRINANFSVNKNSTFYRSSFNNLVLRSSLVPSVMLGYKF